MKRSFEIPAKGELHEIIDSGRVCYRFSDGDTMFTLTTSDNLTPDETKVSRYLDAKVTVVIVVDEEKASYEGITL